MHAASHTIQCNAIAMLGGVQYTTHPKYHLLYVLRKDQVDPEVFLSIAAKTGGPKGGRVISETKVQFEYLDIRSKHNVNIQNCLQINYHIIWLSF